MLSAYALTPKSGGRMLALRALVGLTGAGADTRTTWVHLAYEGGWMGHSEGPFELTRDDFASCVAAFEAQTNPIRVDYDHASLRENLGQPVPSAGYIQKLELRDTGLWALVEFTKRCAEMIRAGEQRFCSAVFVFGDPDRKSGEPVRCFVHSLAMTDTPFIDGQTPIALSMRRLGGTAMKVKREALMELLEKIEGDEIESDQLHAAIDAAAATAVAIEGAPKEAEGAELKSKPDEKDKEKDAKALPAEAATGSTVLADMPVGDPAATPPGAPMDPAAVVARLEAIASKWGVDLATCLARIEEMASADNPAALKAEVAALNQTVRTLSSRIEVHDKREADAKAKAKAESEAAAKAAIDAEVDALVTSGRILKADIEEWRPLAHADLSRFRTLTTKLPQAVPTGAGASAHATPPPADLPVDETHPAIVALNQQLDRFGVTDQGKRKDAIARQWKMVAG